MGIETELVAVLGASSASFLGHGTFGDTWRVDGLDGGGETVAVKVLRPEHFNPALLGREAGSLRDFSHPGIVALLDVRKVALEGEERHILVCEFIDGGSVGDSLRSKGIPSH